MKENARCGRYNWHKGYIIIISISIIIIIITTLGLSL
jgi:hypothetical protein